MRRLDFPYKKRTQITSKSSKVTLTRTTRAGTSGLARNFRAEIISSSPLALNLQAAYYFGWRWSQKQSCRSCNGEKLFSWSLFHPRSSWCRNRPRKSANNVKIPVFGAHRVQTFGLARNLPGSFARNFRGKLMQHTVLALTFAYELRFRRFLYQNRSFWRDEDNMCRNFFGLNEKNKSVGDVFWPFLLPSFWFLLSETHFLDLQEKICK